MQQYRVKETMFRGKISYMPEVSSGGDHWVSVYSRHSYDTIEAAQAEIEQYHQDTLFQEKAKTHEYIPKQ